VEAVTDEAHRPGAGFAVEACRLAQVEEDVFVDYFLQASKGNRRDVLNGWKIWLAYCNANNYTAQDMVEEKRPDVAYARFVQYMGKTKTPEYLIARAKPTVKELFGALGKTIVENPFVQVVVKSNTAKTKSAPKYSEIWNLGILLKHISSGPKLTELPWREQMGRVAATLMIFVPLRPCAMFRIDPTTEKRGVDGNAVKVKAQDKTDVGKGVTMFTLRTMEQEAFSPAAQYQMLRPESQRRGSECSLWRSNKESHISGWTTFVNSWQKY
jgi:hypothetical protein